MTTPTSSPATRRTWQRWGGLAAVVLIPLAFAGLFVGALSQGNDALDSIPVAIVNDDELQVTTAPDGTEQNVFAGRQLVTELTGSEGFDWTITNSDDADAALKAGEVYAILTVPADFSDSILSLSSDNPTKADIQIRTDDAHSYLTGSVAQVVGQTMADTFGNAITAQYIGGIYASLGGVGGSLAQAADGAAQLSSGAGSLSSGLVQYTDGVGGVASGASSLASGVSQYTTGVSGIASGASSLASGLTDYTGGVNSLSGGLSQLANQTTGLGGLAAGVQGYTGSVSSVSSALNDLNADPTALLLSDPRVQEQIATLQAIAAQGPDLAGGAAGLPALEAGIAQTAGGAAQLAAGSGALVSGANGLASGASQLAGGSGALVSGVNGLASGASQLAGGSGALVDGANGLASGASDLASGLQAGADQIPATDSDAAAASAEIAADPVTVSVTTENPVSDLGQIVATFFVPLGLWLGALAVFLVLRPVTRRALTSSARNGRLVASTLARACLVTAAQAIALVALLHGGLGVEWSLLPATLGFSLLTAVAFTAFHYLLTIGLGRAGLVVSLFVLAIQITSTGGIYPIEVLAAPFQVVSPFLPLTYAVEGMQGILAGGSGATVASSVFVLLGFGIGSVLLALLAIRKTRRAGAIGLIPATV